MAIVALICFLGFATDVCSVLQDCPGVQKGMAATRHGTATSMRETDWHRVTFRYVSGCL